MADWLGRQPWFVQLVLVAVVALTFIVVGGISARLLEDAMRHRTVFVVVLGLWIASLVWAVVVRPLVRRR